MNYALLDGTEVEYRVLTPADVAAAVYGTTDDTEMFVEVIRLAAAKPETVRECLAGLPAPNRANSPLGYRDHTSVSAGASEIGDCGGRAGYREGTLRSPRSPCRRADTHASPVSGGPEPRSARHRPNQS